MKGGKNMNLWLNPSHYFSYNKETISNRSIIFRNLGLVLISMFFVTCILFQLLPDMMEGSLFVTFAFITAISVPFYFIFNFFISLLYLMVLIFFLPH